MLAAGCAAWAERCSRAEVPLGSWPAVERHDNFVFHADFSLERYQQALSEIGSLRRQLHELLEIEISHDAVDVYLFSQHDTYESYLRRYLPGVPDRKALFVKSNSPGNVFAYLTPEFTVDLRHECTHAMLHASLPNVPLWLDEGLAEYFEIAPDQQSTAHVHLVSFRRSVRWRSAPSLAELESLDNLRQMGKREYRDAWAWVHFLVHGPPAAQQTLVEYLQDLQAQRPTGRFSERLAQQLPDAERHMREHFVDWPVD